ncbi:MAG: SPFH domain-containing protein [Armatimonadota bacterium]|nr:SPFH domain-containing protein [Armatimonadota bacterium]
MIVLWSVLALAVAAGVALWAARYTKVGPNEVLIISGRRRRVRGPDGSVRTVGYRLVLGGGTFVWPVREKVQRLSLELMTLEVRAAEVYTAHAIPVTVDGVAQVRVRSDEAGIATAAQQFLSRSREDVMRTVQQTLEGHLRAAIGTMTVEEIYRGRDALARTAREAAAEDLAKMGLEIVSLTIRTITDSQGYLEALARPRIAQVKRDAVKAEAEAEREAQQTRLAAEAEVEQARRDLAVRKAAYEAEVAAQRAQADLAYELHRHRVSQQVKAEQMQVSIVEKDKAIELEAREILRREKELVAQVLKPAQAERERIQMLAEAERHRLAAEAAGRAEGIRATGAAEAEALRLKGIAEAEAMEQKARSWSQYTEAALTDLVIRILPDLARAVAEPLARTDKIILIGNGDGAGASRVTGEVTRVLAQLPAVVEALTGMKLDAILRRLPGAEAPAADRRPVPEAVER